MPAVEKICCSTFTFRRLDRLLAGGLVTDNLLLLVGAGYVGL